NHQDYLIFGEPLIPEMGKHFFRRTRIVYAHRRANGSWTSDPFLRRNELGVGQYDASWARIEAEWYFAASLDTHKRELDPGGGFAVAVAPGSWLQFPQVHHLRPKQRLVLALSPVARSGLSIEVRRGDHRGALLGRVAIAAPERGQAAQMEPALELEIGNEPGTIDLCFVFTGVEKDLALFDYWRAVSPDPQN
ncbi:MAG: carbohydrate-binding protein, partial [Lentisphaerae bacterium]|nr:carbohydrate-binding protein [Lentisphaerota bacterium]